MPLITDPDLLTDSATDNGATEVFVNLATKRIKLNATGNLVAADGVTIQAVYSFLKEEWTQDPLNKNFAGVGPYPMVPITDEFFELVEGWDWENTATESYLRRGGWLVRNATGAVTKHFAGIAVLNAQADDQIYFDTGGGATNFTYPGNTAEAVQVLSDPNGDGSYADGFDRSANVNVYNREQGQLFSQGSTAANGEASLLAPKLFSIGLPTGVDLNIEATDLTISGSAPYTGMSITFHSTPQNRSIGLSFVQFGITIDGNNGSKQQIYEFVQWALRQNTDQDDGSGALVGQLMPGLLEFVGSTLKTKPAVNYRGGGSGVYIDNFSAIDTNDLAFVDNSGVERTFPFVAALSIAFNPNLQNDPDARFWVYFTDGVNSGNAWGEASPVLVQDNSGDEMEGIIGGSASIALDFDYDGNTQAGRTASTDVNITVVAIGLQTGQYVRATGTIARSTANAISLVAAIERQYDNAA